jgi:hypothetical protein
MVNLLIRRCTMKKQRNSYKRYNDFQEAFKQFLAEYKIDRVADVHEYLEKDDKYKALQSSKNEKEKALLAAIIDDKVGNLLLEYISAVDFMLDEFETIYYEHGLWDCTIISKEMQKGIGPFLSKTFN